jgi:hypothetical protein
MPTNEIDNSMDIIDSRDVIARIEKLESWREDRIEELKGMTAAGLSLEEQDKLEGLENEEERENEDDNARELRVLKALAEEAEGYAPDWRYGETLIRESYFEQYAQDLTSDLYGKEINDAKWPFNHIDWREAAEDLKQDYTTVIFDGEEYLVRTA